MAKTVIKIENLSKIYRLGEIGTGTISHDLNRWWKMNIRGQEDPFAKIDQVNDRTTKAKKGDLVAALSNINIEVKQGEILGVIGQNGAGKSTLLKILSRVTSPTTGSIKTLGRMASLLEVGTGFHPEMTGRENIYMNGTIMGMRKWEIDKQLDAIVDFSGVAKYLDTPVKRYSSGMTVRLGFAIAAHLEPEILIVDEVLAVGDAEFQKKAIGKMQDVSKNDGRTVLFVSHNMGAVKNLCKTGLLLENGMQKLVGPIDYVISNYNTIEKKQDEKIISQIKYSTNNIKINTIKVNDSEYSHVKLTGGNSQLKFKIQGDLVKEQRVAFEIRIFDINRFVLATYSQEQMTGIVRKYPSGKFHYEFTLYLPKNINKGEYIIDLYITDPGIEGFAEIKNCLIVDIEGITTGIGNSLEYNKGNGLLFLH